MLTAVVALLFVAFAVTAPYGVVRVVREWRETSPDPVDQAYHTLPAGRPAPPVDTVNAPTTGTRR